MRPLLQPIGIALLSSALLGCLLPGPELRPYVRPDVDGFVVTMHSSGRHDYQLVLWHPHDHFYAYSESQIPFQAKLIGDPQMPITNVTEKFDYKQKETTVGVGGKVGPVFASVQSTEGRKETTTARAARTGWTFSQARWEEHRPFRLVLIRGFKPLTEEKRMELEITLGPTVGSVEGLTVRKVSMDPIP